MNIWDFMKTVEEKEKEEEKEKAEEVKQVAGGGGAVGVIEEPEDPLMLLNESIEDKYKEFTKLQKTLSDFSLEDIPQAIQPSIVANYNKQIERFNELIGELQINIAERDQIYKKQYVAAEREKRLEASEEEMIKREEPTYGDIIHHSLKSGLAGYQASLVNLIRTLEMGRVKLGEAIFPFTKGTKYQRWLLDSLTKVVEDSEKIATVSAEQSKSKHWLKNLLDKGLRPVPQIVGSVAMGMGMPVPTGMAAAKPLAEITGRVTQMFPFGGAAAAGAARQIEKEYEALGKETPYYAMVIGGALVGAGEMATELPVFMGVARLLKGGVKAIINEGAKTLVGKYGKLGVEFGKNVALQSWQEGEMVFIEKGIRQALGLPTDWSIKPLVKEFGEAVYGGFAMALVMGSLGGSVAGSTLVASKTMEAVDNVIRNKGDIKKAIRRVAEMQGLIAEMPEAEVYAAEPEELTPKELEAKREMLREQGVRDEELLADDEWVKRARVTKIPKVEEKITPEEEMTPEELEELRILREAKVVPKEEVTKEKVLEKVEPKVEPKKEDFEALKTTEKNEELFYEKYNNVYIETKQGYDKLLDEQVKNLKEEGFKGVEKGGLKRDEEGEVIGRYPSVSKNPKWYRDFYARENKKPSNADLREIAREQLLRGHIEDYGEVPANEVFIKLEAQLDNYEAILSDIKDGDYSFETPKNIEKLNEKLKEMGKENKKIVKDLKAELTTLKAERKAKYVELKKVTEAEKKVEVEVGIKKAVKVIKAEMKGKAIKGMPEAEVKEGNKLIKEISIMVKNRGFTDKQYSDIKMKHGGARHLTGKTKRMTIPQLQAVLKAVEKARPRQIGHEKVITLKTEKKIQSLKDSLITKQQMSEEAYQEILKDEGIYKEPKYVDARHFITEEKGKELIYRLIDESNLLRITEPLRIALEKNPEAKKLADAMEGRIRLEGKERKKDPHELNSMRKYIQIMEGMTKAPFFAIYQDLIDSHLENRADLNNLIMEFDEFRDVIKDEEALKRVEIWILNQSNLKGVPKVSKKITKEEIALAKKIQEVLKDYEARARTEKFLDNIEDLNKMPQYIKYRKEINKAKDIYESKGYDELVAYMKTQEWGVIKSGYDPLQVVSAQVRLYKAKSTTLGKNHIKVRKDIEYKEQDKNVIQRLFSYKRQMDNLSVMRLKIRAFVTLTDKNLDKFKDPNRVKTTIEVFFRELKGYDRPENWFDRGLNRLYAQAMTTIIMGSPALAFRNLGQNIGLGHDKMMLIDPRNKNLTPEELDYLETYVQQAEFMRIDWFMTGEKPLPGLKFLTDIIKKVNLYPRSDIANRHWGYWAKINQIRMAFDKDVSLEKKMKAAKFSDMTLLEQKRALQILSKDGQKVMEKYVARVYVDDVHFIYERAQRAPAEMGRMGRVFGNLMLFPRAYWEKLAQHSKKMTDKKAPFREQVRAFKVIASVLIGGALVSVAYQKVTGRRKPPYDPFELLAYQPGGLAVQTINAVSDVFTNLVLASKGDERALAALTTAIPNALDMFVPFYNYALRGIEATTDTKNIDRLALRKLRMLIDKEYQVRGGAYKLERKAMEKWQYFLGGAGIDVAIKEREKKEKELKKKIKLIEPEGFGERGFGGVEPEGFGD